MPLISALSSDECHQNPLKGVKEALAESLDKAVLALATFSKQPDDPTSLRHCLNHLQQIKGVLQILGLRGANLLAAEIEAVGQYILTRKTEASIPLLETLIRGMVLLQGYLKDLETGTKDSPLRVLTVVNELRVARGETPWIPVDLFEPDLTAPLPPTLSMALGAKEDALRPNAARLRLHFEAALLHWFRDPGGEGLSRLVPVITELRQRSSRIPTLRLWWLAQGITEALQEGGLQPNQEIKLLLGSLDKQIKTLVQAGEPALAASIPETLLKSLLFQVAKATSSGKEVTAIKAAYHLEHYLPAAGAALPTHLRAEAIEAVLASLGEELDHAKDLLDILARAPHQSQQNLAALKNLLRKFTDTFIVLGLNEPLPLLQELLSWLERQTQEEATLDKVQRQKLACTLLQMEALLEKEIFFSQHGGGEVLPVQASTDAPPSLPPVPISRSNVQAAQQAAIRECLAELTLVTRTLANSPTDSQKWASLSPKIQQMAAVLTILGLSPIAALLVDCQRCLCEALIEKKEMGSSPPREALATALSAIEIALEMEGAGMPASRSLLDTAAARLVPVLESLASLPARENQPLTAEADPPPVAPEAFSEPLAGLTATFLEEAEELLQTSQALLLAWQQTPSEEAPVAELQRKLHTLKGGAHLAGLIPLADLAHHMETVFSVLAGHNQTPKPALLGLLQRCLERLWTLFDHAQEGAPLPSIVDLLAEIEQYTSRADKLEQQTPSAPPPQGPGEGAPDLPTPLSLQTPAAPSTMPSVAENQAPPVAQIRIRADTLDHLFNHTAELDQSCSWMGRQVETLYSNLSQMEQRLTHLAEQLHGLEHETPAPISPESQQEPAFQETARDALQSPRFRDLLERINDLTHFQITLKETVQGVDALCRQQTYLSTQLQQNLKNAERLPFAGITLRLQRLVHHTAQALNKHVRLEIRGDEMEFKQTLLNRIIVPLEHMLRNSISHGIETPSERIAAGKEETGTIHLSLAQEKAEILIRVSDDGRGIDLEKVRATALAQGLIQTEAMPTDDRLIRLILEPGLSTASGFSPFAGRGVGMDIVAHEIHHLQGSVEIASRKGEGATFMIRLPGP